MQAFQDIKKLDNFLTKCNLLFEDPYVEEHPSHSDAIVARRSISYVDEFFRQRGFINVCLIIIIPVCDVFCKSTDQ